MYGIQLQPGTHRGERPDGDRVDGSRLWKWRLRQLQQRYGANAQQPIVFATPRRAVAIRSNSTAITGSSV